MALLLVGTSLVGSFGLAASSKESYDEARALKYLQYSRVAFCARDSILKWSCGDMCKDTKAERGRVTLIGPGEAFGVRAYVARVPDTRTCIIAFRGSVSTKNWMTDAEFWTQPWRPYWCHNCEVHHGIAAAYDELRIELREAIARTDCTVLEITGHSLGGAVATVATMDFRMTDKQVSSLWTFGSPRVGNLDFSRAFVRAAQRQGVVPSWRVVHYHDPVPQGPSSRTFTHVPIQVYYATHEWHEFRKKPSGVVVCPWTREEPENMSCGLRQLRYSDIIDGFAKSDHLNYMNKTFGMKSMNVQCRPENICLHYGYITRNKLILVFFLSFCTGTVFVCILTRCKAARKKHHRGIELSRSTFSKQTSIASS